MKTSHSFARELLKMPELPLFVNDTPCDIVSSEVEAIVYETVQPMKALFVYVQELPNAES